MGLLGSLSPAASIAVGILVGLLSTCIQSIGLTLQRKSHLLEEKKEDEVLHRPPYRRRRWQLGMLMFILSNLVGSTIQITTLPLPVLSTLQASGLVFNTICATLILGEPFTRWSLIGTALVAGGAMLIARFGALPEPSHNLRQLLDLLARPQFIIWMLFTGLLIVATLSVAYTIPRLFPHRKHTPRIRLLKGMAFGFVSAILSAHSLLVAKSAVELIVRTIVDQVNQFKRWQSWIILLSLLAFALSQLYFLHHGLKQVSTSVLYPFVFCVYNIIAILDGLIYFHQTDRLPPLHAGLIALGTTILLSGVLALSWRLDDEYSAAPAEAHTLLTPGMGVVEDTATDESGLNSATSPSELTSEDEEAAVGSTERTPLLPSGQKLTPTAKDNVVLHATRQRRQRLATDADEIWAALQDEELDSKAISRARRASTMTHQERSIEDSDEETPLAASRTMGDKSSALRRSRTLAEGNNDGHIRTKKTWRQRRRQQLLRSQSRSVSSPLFSASRIDERQPESSARRPRTETLTRWLGRWIRGGANNDDDEHPRGHEQGH
ncbi:MAG: hypothetical protein M1831_005473 [Alyxoria varia]|nr:MAG: hypothetical protein M1831_005473 [Alyxoria varia]